jgi:hypothetical protein
MKTPVKSLAIAFAAIAFSVTAQAAVITSATTSIEANLDVGSPNSSAWFFGTDYFASYGPLTAAEWNASTGSTSRGGATLQWNLTGINPGDTMGTVGNASISLVSGNDAAGNTYKAYRLTGAITGNSTWNSKPLLDTSAVVPITLAAGNTLYNIDVSSLLALNGGLTTFGIAILVDNIVDTGDKNFWSTAYGNTWPANNGQNKLSANYSVVPEPSTYAMLALAGAYGMATMYRRRRQS